VLLAIDVARQAVLPALDAYPLARREPVSPQDPHVAGERRFARFDPRRLARRERAASNSPSDSNLPMLAARGVSRKSQREESPEGRSLTLRERE
jgi:hypothetical protein